MSHHVMDPINFTLGFNATISGNTDDDNSVSTTSGGGVLNRFQLKSQLEKKVNFSSELLGRDPALKFLNCPKKPFN